MVDLSEGLSFEAELPHPEAPPDPCRVFISIGVRPVRPRDRIIAGNRRALKERHIMCHIGVKAGAGRMPAFPFDK